MGILIPQPLPRRVIVPGRRRGSVGQRVCAFNILVRVVKLSSWKVVWSSSTTGLVWWDLLTLFLLKVYMQLKRQIILFMKNRSHKPSRSSEVTTYSLAKSCIILLPYLQILVLVIIYCLSVVVKDLTFSPFSTPTPHIFAFTPHPSNMVNFSCNYFGTYIYNKQCKIWAMCSMPWFLFLFCTLFVLHEVNTYLFVCFVS